MQFKLLERLDDIPAPAWDALHDGANPFLSHAFLAGLERHGCLRPAWGWTPRHATLWRDGELVAAAPAYLKANSHGEFVFDHAWADAYARAGLDYFPKWLVAVPYTPVTGPRLLARDGPDRAALLAAMREQAGRDGLSSLHVNFHPAGEDPAFDAGWLAREDVQFHWHNRGWADFEAFLADLQPKKRKNLRQERAKAERAGYAFRVVHGDEASESDLEAMYYFYCRTFADYGNHPALSLEFFRHLATAMPRQLVLVLAERAGEVVAGALCLRGHDTLYGRYWGASEPGPGLHFETCYHQGIEYCLREKLAVFEPGAQGVHKIARGFLPVTTRSHHHVSDPRFAAALADWCAQERDAVARHRANLLGHHPYRELPADPVPAR
ncbi:GNAT family N-acetyltransferase [Arenimonas caeni]|jgi:predicted N-acyltransferase|uniref:GNAT family N-acetyltransferase n=1 Tax=Arenimonas caeni TaxID=2058085 RepID=A0A2P6MAS2_9GAMM|nr:GNAT family N-acetyltransferase [Arenimonas caeni]MDY0021430.1 GNAT family N-acetyltransferase [Arenimonas caeni]PRH83093.1 GNAT family N-acetyltransferase [Arenimonas caeni]